MGDILFDSIQTNSYLKLIEAHLTILFYIPKDQTHEFMSSFQFNFKIKLPL